MYFMVDVYSTLIWERILKSLVESTGVCKAKRGEIELYTWNHFPPHLLIIWLPSSTWHLPIRRGVKRRAVLFQLRLVKAEEEKLTTARTWSPVRCNSGRERSAAWYDIWWKKPSNWTAWKTSQPSPSDPVPPHCQSMKGDDFSLSCQGCLCTTERRKIPSVCPMLCSSWCSAR